MSYPLSTYELLALRDWIRRHWGIFFSDDRLADLNRQWRRYAEWQGHRDGNGLLRRLLDDDASKAELDKLLALLTVGETYFMRETKTLDLLEAQALLPLIKQRADNSRSLKIWSAGCCTGEEAYTLAMMLQRLIPCPDQWNIEIIATDINPAYLEKARIGCYTDWSFRQLADGVKHRHFKETQGQWKIRTRMQKWTSWHVLNLMDVHYTKQVPALYNVDVILCRNVLMYFHMADAAAVVQRFHDVLRPGGWLAVGASESCHTNFASYEPVYTSQACLYRKSDHNNAEPVELPEPLSAVTEKNDYRTIPDLSAFVSAVAAPQAVCHVKNPLRAALENCNHAIAADRLNPVLYRQKALLLGSMKDKVRAIQAWKTVLFLAPHDAMAHFSLGQMFMEVGKDAAGRRCYENALELLDDLNSTEEVPHGDGLRVSQLRQWIFNILNGDLDA